MDTPKQRNLEQIVDRHVWQSYEKRNPYRPRYQLVCGKVKRLLSPEAVIERFERGKWVEEKRQH
jgi:hypothetical protein